MNKLYFKKIIDDNRFKKFPEFDNYKNLRILKQAWINVLLRQSNLGDKKISLLIETITAKEWYFLKAEL